MRLLFAIPHFYSAAGGGRHGSLGGPPGRRAQRLADTLVAIQQLFGRPQCLIDIARRTTTPANDRTAVRADVVVCTTGTRHLLERIPLGEGYFTHIPTNADPHLLGFECHAALRDWLGGYDFYCYLEDDLVLHDPWFFVKCRWFVATFGEECVLMPNRYEVARGRIVQKAYIDGPLRPEVTAPFQDISIATELSADVFGESVSFRRPLNPHCGGFFLTANQMEAWTRRPDFLDRNVSFVGPLESAATLGVMRAFRVYKPAVAAAAFLEIEHAGTAFLDLIKPAGSAAAPPGAGRT